MSEQKFLPYGRQNVTQQDIDAVSEVLSSDWLTQGPAIPEFEHALADYLSANEVVACSSGTAALHLAMLALGIGEGDVIITTPNTFVASANCARFVGAQVQFADINPNSGLIDTQSIKRLLEQDNQGKIKAILPVHFAGQPVELPAIYELAQKHGAYVIDDACHAIGASYEFEGKQCKVGDSSHSDMTVFSFHPVKHIATGEGGAIATNSEELAEKLRLFRNHGITRDGFINDEMSKSEDGVPNPWYHEMHELGFNYRITDIQAALGVKQLERLPRSIQRRNEIADSYRKLISKTFSDGTILPLVQYSNRVNSYHLFVVKINFEKLGVSRAVVMNRLRATGIGTQVHYIPVHLQPYYRRVCGTAPGYLPDAEAYYEQALSLPMYPELTDNDLSRIVSELARAIEVPAEEKAVR
ncbi:MAG: UDP-4-amino-4,6-dideoxy-N-acetyl-beta-L-altrosamine transaminase [candidate division Zixibacteria bacterium]|nr:UDP-4-amino-4,6-dideoxy-N-acetyl-beta-L-altrosamine transaminase [candidate division Zixibacteria bacterium]